MYKNIVIFFSFSLFYHLFSLLFISFLFIFLVVMCTLFWEDDLLVSMCFFITFNNGSESFHMKDKYPKSMGICSPRSESIYHQIQVEMPPRARVSDFLRQCVTTLMKRKRIPMLSWVVKHLEESKTNKK